MNKPPSPVYSRCDLCFTIKYQSCRYSWDLGIDQIDTDKTVEVSNGMEILDIPSPPKSKVAQTNTLCNSTNLQSRMV